MTSQHHSERAISDDITVGRAASMLGVTVRTLHHWDEIGLVRPSERSHSGYRIYTAEDLSRLHRVLLYRELDIPLGEISQLLEAGTEDALESLTEQRERLTERIHQLQRMSLVLDELIDAQQSGISLSSEEQIELFGKDWDPNWTQQARQRWGGSVQWTQYAERSARRSTADWEEIARRTEALDQALVQAFASGVRPGDSSANELAEKHRTMISEHFDCSHSMHVCIARMYTEGGEFHRHYEQLAAGLSAWLKGLIDANARAAGLDPEAAQWE